MTGRLVALQGAEVDYRGRRALGPIDLSLEPGALTAVVGPSGCGKSTALRLIAGIEAPSRGTVARTVERGETAVVFQAPTLMPWAGALTNVALPLELSGVSRDQARMRAGEALARVGLGGAETLRPAQLSGGMAMRAALARALVVRPKLMLLDEPFAALDEITRRTLADDVLALWAETRPAVVFVTHNVEEAVYMAQRVVVLTPGPGRVFASFEIAGPLPRPAGFRTSETFRLAAEQVSAALLAAVRGAAA